jgi:NADH-dependent peroxiredoxin subunit C
MEKNENDFSRKPLIGEKVNEMEVEAFCGNEFKKLKISDYAGKWVVLLFYPADFTFICPTELEAAADDYAEFKNLGAEVLSVSTDSVYAHKAWKDISLAIKKIGFPMIADPTGNFCRSFGVYDEKRGNSFRATFIADPDGVIKSYEIHDNDIGRNIKEIIRKLQAAKFVQENKGHVCPADWKPGEKTLKPGVDLVGTM